MRLRTIHFVVALALSATVFAQTQEEAPPQPIVPMETQRAGQDNLPRHTGQYQPLQLRWQLHRQVRNVLAVYPHPFIPERIYLATTRGLLVSHDTGLAFEALPQATTDAIGEIASIAFHPFAPDRFLIATLDHGLWETTDAGKTLHRLASADTGLASDSVRAVHFSSEDDLRRTLIAIHGDDAPGLSLSADEGKTWRILFPEQHVHNVFWLSQSGKRLLLEVSPIDDIDKHTVYYLASLQEPWQKLIDDVFLTGAAASRESRDDTIILATADQGLFRVSRQGAVIRGVGPSDITGFASLDAAWFPHADLWMYFAYHPKKFGMVVFTPDQLKNTMEDDAALHIHSDGLFTGPLVMEGAHIRAAANARVFFAAVNRTLYRSTLTGEGLTITDLSITPPVVLVDRERMKQTDEALLADLNAFNSAPLVSDAAVALQPRLQAHLEALADRRFTVRATVQSSPADPVRSVTVDLSRLRRSTQSPLFDDGRHDDGEAGDGVYANTFSIDFSTIRSYGEDWRGAWPGPLALTVSAASDTGVLAGAVAPLVLWSRHESIPFLANSGITPRSDNVSTGQLRPRGSPHNYKRITIRSPGEWSVSIQSYNHETVDMTGQRYLAFHIRSSQSVDADLSVQLRDAPTYSRSATTRTLSLSAEGLVPDGKFSPTEQRILIPIEKLLKDSGDFQPSIASQLILSGTASQPVDLLIRGIQFLPTEPTTTP